MDEGIKPIVPLVILAIIGGLLFVAASGIGGMIIDGIQKVIVQLFSEASISVTP